MFLCLKTTIAILVALWLPVQAVAGIVMALYGTQEPVSLTMSTLSTHELAMSAGCRVRHHASDAVTVVKGAKLNAKCNYCGVCQLASTGFLLSRESAITLIEFDHYHFLPFKAMFFSYIPEPPQKPPKQFA